MYKCVHIRVYICIGLYLCICVHIYVCTHTHTLPTTHTHTHTNPPTYSPTHPLPLRSPTHMYIHICTYVYTYRHQHGAAGQQYRVHTATHCNNTLQHTATSYCNTLQHTERCCDTLHQYTRIYIQALALSCGTSLSSSWVRGKVTYTYVYACTHTYLQALARSRGQQYDYTLQQHTAATYCNNTLLHSASTHTYIHKSTRTEQRVNSIQ